MKNMLLIAVCVFISACNTLKVVDDFDPKYDYAKLKTFALLEGGGVKEAGEVQNTLLTKHINRSIGQLVSEKGFQLAEEEDADFLISWYGAIDKNIHEEKIRQYSNRYYNTNWRSANYASWMRDSSAAYQIEYEKGILIIDILDGKKRELIWRGKGSKIIGDRTAGENIAQRVHSVVNDILKTFPPK